MVGSLRSPDKTPVIPFISKPKPIRTSHRQPYTLIIKNLLILLSLTLAWQILQIYSIDSTSSPRQWISPEEAHRIFLSVPDAQSAIQASRLFTKEPHTAGTNGDFNTAKNYLSIIQQDLGITPPDQYPLYPAGSSESRNATLSIPHLTSPVAWIDEYYPVLNYPLDRVVEIVDDDGHIVWSANLEEVADEKDPDAYNAVNAAPAYCAYSPDADVTGKLVYAHYGRYQDFADLIAKGVNLTGAVVIARYGGISRGLKAKRAQELGATALLVYNDINDDGTVTPKQGYEPYPEGPARNPTSVQRGSVHFMSVMAGDMSTPGYPAYENATRVDVFAAPDIPVLPISWLNAQILLKETRDGGRRIHLSNHGENKITPIWNVMGVIPGHIGNEIVILGNHRDSWATGGTDPSSGTSSMREVIRGFGELLRAGWKPLRTIVIASWDAEEFSVIGSTEWCEDFAEFLGSGVKVVAYVNVDSSAAGSRFRAGASPSLSHIYRDVAQSLDHPTDKGRTLWDAKKDSGKLMGNRTTVIEQETAEGLWRPLRDGSDSISIRAVDKLGVSALGSGSDFTPFLAYLGIASVNTGFSSTLHDPVWHYHSIFDTQTWQERFGDPGFKRHIAVSKFMGLLALHLSGDYVVPLNTTHYTLELDVYLDKIAIIANASSIDINLSPLRAAISNLQNASSELDIEKTEAEQELRDALQKWHEADTLWTYIKRKVKSWPCFNTYYRILGRDVSKDSSSTAAGYNSEDVAAATIKKHPRSGKRIQPRIGHAGGVARRRRRQAELELAHAFGESYGVDIAHHLSSDHGHDRLDGRLKTLVKAIKRVQAVNAKLIAFERGFVSPEGLPERPFYRHLGVAPGRYLGYGATPLPGVYEALVFEADVGAAENEAGRLAALMNRLAERLRT